MFADVLDSHPRVRCYKEALNDVRSESSDAQLNRLIELLSNQPVEQTNPTAGSVKLILGATINPFKHDWTEQQLSALFERLPGIAVMTLTRTNRLRQAISIYFAEQFGWRSSRTQFKSASRLPTRQHIDVDQIANIVRTMDVQSQKLTSWTGQLADVLHIEFESLIADGQTTVNDVFRLTGADPVGPDFDFRAGYQKILPDNFAEIIENHHELETHPQLSRFL